MIIEIQLIYFFKVITQELVENVSLQVEERGRKLMQYMLESKESGKFRDAEI